MNLKTLIPSTLLFFLSNLTHTTQVYSTPYLITDQNNSLEHHHLETKTNEDNHHHDQEHQTLEIPPEVPTPTVDFVIHEDAIKGWNLELKVTNFEFLPPTTHQDNIYNQGHAHLYVNDTKVTRIYGSWYYLSSLPPGRNQIKVTLNNNNHQSLSFNNNIVGDTEIIEVK
jgi:hypothetical protein